jgi:hypothetical protein
MDEKDERPAVKPSKKARNRNSIWLLLESSELQSDVKEIQEKYRSPRYKVRTLPKKIEATSPKPFGAFFKSTQSSKVHVELFQNKKRGKANSRSRALSEYFHLIVKTPK